MAQSEIPPNHPKIQTKLDYIYFRHKGTLDERGQKRDTQTMEYLYDETKKRELRSSDEAAPRCRRGLQILVT